jgi:hypothetical protein
MSLGFSDARSHSIETTLSNEVRNTMPTIDLDEDDTKLTSADGILNVGGTTILLFS